MGARPHRGLRERRHGQAHGVGLAHTDDTEAEAAMP
jgi:hypothetical protein